MLRSLQGNVDMAGFPADGSCLVPWTICLATASRSRPYGCSSCGRSFKKKAHLQEHYLLHTGQKPFVCQYCQKSFTRARTLKTHVIVVHKESHK